MAVIGHWLANDFADWWANDFVDFWEDDFVGFWEDVGCDLFDIGCKKP